MIALMKGFGELDRSAIKVNRSVHIKAEKFIRSVTIPGFVIIKEVRRVSAKNLDEAIQAAGNPVKMLRNSQLGPYVYPVVP